MTLSHPRPSRACWSLAMLTLVMLAGCSASGDEAELCADVECSAGLCYADDGQPRCRCADWEQNAGLLCERVTPEMLVDDHGDVPADATVLAVAAGDVEVPAGLQRPSAGAPDRDVFAFAPQAMHHYQVSCVSRSLLECTVRLLDASGRELSVVKSSGPSAPARLAFGPSEAAAVYVEVSGRLSGGVGLYSLHVTRAGVDDHGNGMAQATLLQPSGETFGVTRGYVGDLDFFTFRSVARHGYRFTCERDGLTVPVLRMRSALGAQVGHGGRSGSAVTVGLKAEGEATWFVEVGTDESSGAVTRPATYRCRLEDLGRDLHTDVMAGATALTPGTAVSVGMESHDDVDVLSFTGTPGHIYRFDTRGTVRLTHASGTELGRWAYPGKALYETKQAGTYYLHLSDAPSPLGDSSTWGRDFSFLLEDTGLDDHGDTVATATRIAVGSSVMGLLHDEVDVDAISFMADEDGVYRVTCQPECQMELHAESGWVSRQSQFPNGYIIDARTTEPITLSVSGAAWSSTFTLSVERIATDDYGDDDVRATPLTLPVSASGALQSGVDQDAFSVVLQAGRTYVVQSTSFATAEVRMPDRTKERGRFIAPTSGIYIVYVHGDVTARTGPWSFTLREE
ncbi:hypothetical protein ACLESD_16395 [Pyxidicoccus sp. 3LFB2]